MAGKRVLTIGENYYVYVFNAKIEVKSNGIVLLFFSSAGLFRDAKYSIVSKDHHSIARG